MNLSIEFKKIFENHRGNPLSVNQHKPLEFNPFHSIYSVLKKHTLDMLNKNRSFSNIDKQVVCLSPSDIHFLDAHAIAAISDQTKTLEKNLYILSTIVTLAPFLGLLGTVWGILGSFGEMQAHTGNSQTVLAGLSLALTTTVLGLIDAIPALLGYNYLKHLIKDFQTDMELFSNEILASVELQYRQVDISVSADFSQKFHVKMSGIKDPAH